MTGLMVVTVLIQLDVLKHNGIGYNLNNTGFWYLYMELSSAKDHAFGDSITTGGHAVELTPGAYREPARSISWLMVATDFVAAVQWS